MAELASQGYDSLTIERVAERAQTGKASIYRRWPTKQDLVIAAAETRVGVLEIPDLGSFRAELHALLTARMRAYRDVDISEADIHVWQQCNPVVTEALVQLTWGGPQVIYNGGLQQARVRYYDADRRRPGLPPSVAALAWS